MNSNISNLLMQKKWSQRRLALKVGLDPVYINRIIRRNCDIRISTARKIASALGCSLDELFNHDNARTDTARPIFVEGECRDCRSGQ